MDQSARDSDSNRQDSATPGMSQKPRDGDSDQERQTGVIGTATEMARNVGEQAWTAATTPVATAQDLARRAREQTGAIYDRGARAGEYMTRNITEYPATALLVAGAIGYGIAYLVHTGGWTFEGWTKGDDRRGRNRQEHHGHRSDRH